MVRHEKSKMSSLPDAMLEERSHRHSEVVLVTRRKCEQDGESIDQQTSCTEPAHQAAPRVPGEWTQDDWMVLARAGGLLPIPPESTPGGPSALLKLKQPPKLGNEALPQDDRLEQLESQRRLLSGLLGTLFVGSLLLYAMIVRPETGRHEQMIAQLQQTNAEQRSEYERSRGRLTSRISELDSRLAAIRFPIGAVPQPDTKQQPSASTTPTTQQSLTLRASAPKDDRQTPATKAATQGPASPEAPQGSETPQVPAPAETPELPASQEAVAAAPPNETPKAPNLREAMKSAVKKETSPPSKPSEPPPTVSTGCDKNDPLCGDLT